MIRRALALASLVLLTASLAGASEDTRTSVLAAQGAVQVLRAGRTLDAAKGAVLQAGDEIVTSSGASVDVGWAGLWGCRLMGDGKIKIDSLALEDQRVGMERGTMLFRFNKMPVKSAFKLMAPTVTATVRGTAFAATVRPDGGSTLAVLHGKVEAVSATGQTLMLGAGQAVDLTAAGAGDPRALSADETALLGGTETVRSGGKRSRKDRQGYF
ncbi:MAG: hypothetical protein MOGMAGMI_01630 [Candidatus Omnitrophica bacterium]|nr:hypothetical protein [Candidatus Omnitrophota bacterium]